MNAIPLKELILKISNLDNLNLEQIHERLEVDGISKLDLSFPDSFYEKIKKFIDEFPTELAEINYGSTEKRIYQAEFKCDELIEYKDECDKIYRLLFPAQDNNSSLLCIKNEPADRVYDGGRWHFDSFRKQYKIFTFLEDVDEDAGPLEIINQTHTNFFKLKEFIIGNLFRLSDFTSTHRLYQSFDDSYVNKLIQNGYMKSPLTCKKGASYIINVSCIHRAGPCYKNNRYAITNYYL